MAAPLQAEILSAILRLVGVMYIGLAHAGTSSLRGAGHNAPGKPANAQRRYQQRGTAVMCLRHIRNTVGAPSEQDRCIVDVLYPHPVISRFIGKEDRYAQSVEGDN